MGTVLAAHDSNVNFKSILAEERKFWEDKRLCTDVHNVSEDGCCHMIYKHSACVFQRHYSMSIDAVSA